MLQAGVISSDLTPGRSLQGAGCWRKKGRCPEVASVPPCRLIHSSVRPHTVCRRCPPGPARRAARPAAPRCGKGAVLVNVGGQGMQPRKKIVGQLLVHLPDCAFGESGKSAVGL